MQGGEKMKVFKVLRVERVAPTWEKNWVIQAVILAETQEAALEVVSKNLKADSFYSDIRRVDDEFTVKYEEEETRISLFSVSIWQ